MVIVRRHWAVIAVALVLVGTEYVAQRITAFGVEYQSGMGEVAGYAPVAVRGLPYGSKIDEMSYFAVASHMFVSGLPGGDPYIYEHRNDPVAVPYVTIGLLRALIGATPDVDAAYRVAKITVTCAALLSVYLLAVSMGGGVLLPLTAAAAVTLMGPIIARLPLFDLGTNLYDGLVGVVGNWHGFTSQYSRLPYNGFSFPLLIACIWAVTSALDRRDRRSIITAGILVGLQPLIYQVYAFPWALGLIALFAWFILKREWPSVKVLVGIGVVAAIPALPMAYHQMQMSALPQYSDVMFAWASQHREWDSGGLVLMALSAVVWWLADRRAGRLRIGLLVMCGVCLGAAASLNLHVLTGVDFQRWHWTDRVIEPLLSLILMLLAGTALRDRVRRTPPFAAGWAAAAPVIAAVIVTFPLVKFVGARVETAVAWSKLELIPDDHRQGYEWLRDNARRDAVVATLSTDQIALMPIRARTYGYLPYRWASVTSNAEVTDRWTAAARFYGMPEETFNDIVAGESTTRAYRATSAEESAEAPPWWFERTTIHNTLYHKTYRTWGPGGGWYVFPDSVATNLLTAFREVSDPDSAFRRYRVDYVWQGPYERAVGIDSLDRERDVELAFETGRVRIYRVIHANDAREARGVGEP